MGVSRDGGKITKRDVNNYMTPQGPTTFSNSGPGLANRDNYGVNGTQGPSSDSAKSSGSVGIGGENCGNCGSQGKY